MKELEKTYNPADIEDRLYQKWLDNKYFHADAERGRREGKKPFTIVMPPPNMPPDSSVDGCRRCCMRNRCSA